MTRTALAALVFLVGVSASAQDGKTELRYALKKGEKFTIALSHGLSVKLDKVPEILQGVLSEDPINVKFEGVVDAEVTEVSEDGVARIDGTWKTAKAKGHIMVNDIDFAYDAAKKGDAKPKKQDPADDPALAGLGDLQDQLDKMVRTPLKMSVDRTGKVTMVDGSGKLGEIESAFRSLNGLMGPLPKTAVGKGDSWKDELKLGMPGVGGNVDIKIHAVNTIDSIEKADGKDLYAIKSKFTVGKGADEKDAAPTGVDVKIKTEGEGEGKTLFSLTDGRALKSQSSLRVKVSATIPNPGGGDEMDLKAVLKIETTHALGK